MDTTFLEGLIPNGLVQLAVLLAASSGTFYFIFMKILKPVWGIIGKPFYHELRFDREEAGFSTVRFWLASKKDHIMLHRTHRTFNAMKEKRLGIGYGKFMLRLPDYPLILVNYRRTEKEGTFDNETIRLKFLSPKAKHVVKAFKEINVYRDTIPYIYENHESWWVEKGIPREVRNVYGETTRRLMGDIEEFLSPKTRGLYRDRGILYRRGYLLHGIPGTGKSNFVAHVSGRFGLPVYSLGTIPKSDVLTNLLGDIPIDAMKIILLEDVDLSTVEDVAREKKNGKGKSSRNENKEPENSGKGFLRAMLNNFDGIKKFDNAMVFLTTNRKEDLDEALIRPGRIDVQAEFGKLQPEDVRECISKTYGVDYTGPTAETTIAEVVAAISKYPSDPWKAAGEITETEV